MGFKTNEEIGDDVRSRYEGHLQSIRNDASRTAEWKKSALARTYQEMRADRDNLVEQRDTQKRNHQATLENKLFGVGSTSGDVASLVISRRDAGDRAAQLERETEASDLLARANRSGDEPLARAIAERAFEMRWEGVTNDFLATREALGAPMNQLWAQADPNPTLAFVEHLQLEVKPAELFNLQEHEIDRLASSIEPEVNA